MADILCLTRGLLKIGMLAVAVLGWRMETYWIVIVIPFNHNNGNEVITNGGTYPGIAVHYLLKRRRISSGIKTLTREEPQA